MSKVSRREFMQMGASLAALMGLSTSYSKGLAEGLSDMASGRVRIIWLQAQSCSGCSVSFLNATNPAPASVLTQTISLAYHSTIGAAQGQVALDTVDKNIRIPGYILAVEGSIPMKMPHACLHGGRPMEELLRPAIRNAKAVIAVGSCAVFGGMPAAEGNPTGAASVQKFMKANNMDIGKLIALPTCPTHPESVIGTIAYYLKFGIPALDKEHHRPKMFYSCSIHAECPRYHYYQNEIFAQDFGDEKGCLFKLGCLGPLSFANCPRRQWNSGINWCIRANAPCISCSSEFFPSSKDLPFYRKGERYNGGKQKRDRIPKHKDH